MTCSQFSAAFTPNRNDVAALRAALAWVIALIVTPIRRAALESRLERLALAARRNAMLNRSGPSGIGGAIAPVQHEDGLFIVVETAIGASGRYGETHGVAYASADRVPYALADGYLFTLRRERCLTSLCASVRLDVAEPIPPAAPAPVDPPAAPAKPKRVRKPAAPRKPAVKVAANAPVKAKTTKTVRARFPSIKDVAAALLAVKADVGDVETDEDGEQGIDVRLQITEGGWDVHSGDAQYDTDHRGYWGAGWVSQGTNVRELARELIAEAKDDEAQSR